MQGSFSEALSQPRSEQGDARGRPVGVAVDRTGALIVADDVGGTVWRVTAASAR
jgi:glucose/arabinose dehydrogenase